MGLDINPGGAHWSYSGFNQFRRDLAKEEGLNIQDMAGYGGTLEWDDTATDLRPLFNHSDCDGYIDAFDCEDMVPRLKQISEAWKSDSEVGRQYYIDQLDSLIKGMEHCAEHGCALVFT